VVLSTQETRASPGAEPLGRHAHRMTPRQGRFCAGRAERRPDSASNHQGRRVPAREMSSDRYPIALAIANAAAAATPPTSAVCQALFNGFFTVKRPFT